MDSLNAPANKTEAERIWKSEPIETESLESLDTGITTFEADTSASLETLFLDIFDTVNDHHNTYSYADEIAWSLLEAHGACLSKQIESFLAEYGDMKYETFRSGFKCWR